MTSHRQARPIEGNSSQYHHYIPRFILRNFAHPFEPPNAPLQKNPRKQGKRKGKKGCYPGDLVLKTINLAGATAELVDAPVARTFGLTDMYRDVAEATNQHRLEEQLSILESKAGAIVAKIRKEHEAGNPEVSLDRVQRDTLRKFLFIMKYRSSGFHKRFYHSTAEGYSGVDRGRLVEYMREKGKQKPIDIWFDNITGMLELKMDPELKWMDELKKRIYPDDAMWAITHMQGMYLAFCTPSGQDDEFLLTENAYSIFEGPASFSINPDTGESTMQAYTEYHVFAAISPKLIIVLRSFLLPSPGEDSDDGIRKWRETMHGLVALQHNNPLEAGSTLADLPIAKARSSYTKIVSGSEAMADGKDWSPRESDKFFFKIFPISAEHVNKINCIMLEEAYKVSTMAFKSQSAARKTLEHYLSAPTVVRDEPDDQKLAYLKKLEHVLRLWGSDTTAMYQIRKSKLGGDDIFDLLGRMLQKSSLNEITKNMSPYIKLGGSPLTVPKDLDQAAKMLNLRIKIDVWSQGVDERIRVKNREQLRDLFCQLSPRRVFCYLKYTRNMQLKRTEPDERAPFTIEGPEDIIADACQLFRTKDLCRLMYFANLNHVHITKSPEFDVAREISLDENGARHLQQIKALAFGPAGSICDCAIEAVEKKARLFRGKMQVVQIPREYQNPFWTKEQNIEMATRILVKADFSKLLSESLSPTKLESLGEVLFGTVYPTKGQQYRR